MFEFELPVSLQNNPAPDDESLNPNPNDGAQR